MASRVNAFVNSHPSLKQHLSSFTDGRAERFKLLASLGAILQLLGDEPDEQLFVSDDDWSGRINVRISEAHPELSTFLHSSENSQSRTLVHLASLGLECIASGKQGVVESLGLWRDLPDSVEDTGAIGQGKFSKMDGEEEGSVVSKPASVDSAAVALTARLAGDLLRDDDEAIWAS